MELAEKKTIEPIEKTNTVSSIIDSYTYHYKSSTLNVTTKNGTNYLYMDVPYRVAYALHNSKKQGRYYLRNIRKKYVRIVTGWVIRSHEN